MKLYSVDGNGADMDLINLLTFPSYIGRPVTVESPDGFIIAIRTEDMSELYCPVNAVQYFMDLPNKTVHFVPNANVLRIDTVIGILKQEAMKAGVPEEKAMNFLRLKSDTRDISDVLEQLKSQGFVFMQHPDSEQ